MNRLVGGGEEESAMVAPTLLSASGAEMPQGLGGHQERLKVKYIETLNLWHVSCLKYIV